jgi:hypothetical protein
MYNSPLKLGHVRYCNASLTLVCEVLNLLTGAKAGEKPKAYYAWMAENPSPLSVLMLGYGRSNDVIACP